MLIPSKMTEMMLRYFYDKVIEIYTYADTPSPEGGRPTKGKKVTKGSINCNVHYVTNEDTRKEYGVSAEARLMISCSLENEVTISKGDFISYRGEEFRMIEILPHDSHLKVVCQ